MCLCVSFSVSYKDTLIGFWVHFKLILTLTLITSAKVLFPNKVTFEFWMTWIFGRHYSPIVLPCWLRSWRISLKCRKPRFNPWVRKIPWRRQWLPTPLFFPGEFHEERNLSGYTLWGGKESDMTEQLTVSLLIHPQHISFYTWYTAILFDIELNRN